MKECKMYISENQLNDYNISVVRCISLLQVSSDIINFKNLLEKENIYCEIDENKSEVYIKVDSMDKSKLILSAAR